MAEVYTAEHGLIILKYLGITDIDEKEKEVFRAKWEDLPSNRSEYLLHAVVLTWRLYVIELPWREPFDDSLVVSLRRNENIWKGFKESGLEEELRKGRSFSEIFALKPE